MPEIYIIIAMILVVLSVVFNQKINVQRKDIFGEGNIVMAQIQEDVEEELQEMQNNLNKNLAEGKIRVREHMIKEREDTHAAMLKSDCTPEQIERVMQMYNRHIL